MSQFGGDAYDGATAIGDNNGPQMFATDNNHVSAKGKVSMPHYRQGKGEANGGANMPVTDGVDAAQLDFVDSTAYLDTKHPYCVKIGKGGVRAALEELNNELKSSGLPGIISKKKPSQLVGREVNPGRFGLYEYGSQPQLLLEPGKYPGFPLGNWIACQYHGTYDMSSIFPPLDTSTKGGRELAALGLTIVQVSQNQAAVCLDPQSRVFVVASGGFVAAAVSGAYRILGLVDQTHLKEAVKDPYSGIILGHRQTVHMPGGHVAATFLDLPSNCCAILQRKDELYELGAGQHFITTPAVTVRGFYTKGEVQQELEADNTYTRDQVPVYLKVYLRYQLERPLLLAIHGYRTVYDALQDKVRSILTQILAHLDYSSMARSRNLATDQLNDPNRHNENGDHQDDVTTVFVTAVRQQATDELKVVAAEYGVKLEDLAIIDREFRGEIAKSMDRLTTRALEAQVESANLDRENANRRRKQEGDARVQELENTMKRGMAETDASNVIAAARARAEALTIEASARATATKLAAQAEAEATRIKAHADSDINSEFAQQLARNRIEVERTKAYGNKTTFAPLEALNNGGALGYAMLSNAHAQNTAR